MADWVEDAVAKTWERDGLLVRQARGHSGKTIFHVYKDGKYIAQATTSADAKAKAMAGVKKKKG